MGEFMFIMSMKTPSTRALQVKVFALFKLLLLQEEGEKLFVFL